MLYANSESNREPEKARASKREPERAGEQARERARESQRGPERARESQGEPEASGLRTRRHETRGRRPRVKSPFLLSGNRLLTRGLPRNLEKGGGGSEVYSSLFSMISDLIFIVCREHTTQITFKQRLSMMLRQSSHTIQDKIAHELITCWF